MPIIEFREVWEANLRYNTIHIGEEWGNVLGSMELQENGSIVATYWAGETVQVGAESAKFRRYRIRLAKRVLTHKKGAREIWPKDIKFAAIPLGGREYMTYPDIIGSYICFKTTYVRDVAADNNGCKVSGACAKQGVPTHDHDAGLGEAVCTTLICRRTS